MKKIFTVICFFICLIGVRAGELDLAPNAASALLIENSTGKILYQKDIHKKLSPASLTKIMTLLLTMEELDNNIIKLTDKVRVSSNASNMGGTQLFLEEGSEVDVETLLKGITVASANDAAMAIAEYIGRTKENFVLKMNKRCEELGCKNTNFMNPHGLDENDHYTSAYDLSLIARELLKHEKILDYTSIYEDYVKINNQNQWLVNTNKLVRFYKGIDGLKTGYTSQAGYCLIATMKKNDMRLISVVLKEDTKDNRSSDTISMMEYGFSQYGVEKILDRNTFSKTITIDNAKQKEVKYYLDNDVNLIVKKGIKDIEYKIDENINSINAPIKKNSVIGNLKLTYDNNTYNYNLIVKEDVKKANLLDIYYMFFKDTLLGFKI